MAQVADLPVERAALVVMGVAVLVLLRELLRELLRVRLPVVAQVEAVDQPLTGNHIEYF